MFYGILCEKIEDILFKNCIFRREKENKKITHTHTCVPCTRALYLKKTI